MILIVDRIKRLSYEVLEEHKQKFGEDFADNKKVLDQIAIIRSKGLKNEIAGYITKFIKRQIREEKVRQSQLESSKIDNYTLKEKISEDDVIQGQATEIISESEANEGSRSAPCRSTCGRRTCMKARRPRSPPISPPPPRWRRCACSCAPS